MEAALSYSLAVDIGGTFTDVVLRHASGLLTVDKTLTTPHDLIEGFFTGVHAVLERTGLTPREIDGVIVHATTVVTNTLIERTGPATALLVTEGFRDILRIRNEHRYEMYDPQIEFPEPLVPPELTFAVAERIRADGVVLVAPDLEQIDALAAALKARNVRSVAICFLNSFVNPSHERIVGERLGELLPDLFITLSCDVAPQIREFPRASTATVNAYTMPIAKPYLRRLSDRLAQEGFPNSPLIMLSSGGVVGAETAGRNPVRMIESGPAAGALAACHYCDVLGIDRLMSFDMGGTTAKACLIENRQPLITGLFEVDRRYRFKEGSGLPVTIPSIDMIEIGAGGGSIAHADALGLLKVGPHSAGSVPGPACYGRGGKQPTVTDADLVLGLLDADNFLGGDMKLDRAAAEAGMATLARALKLSASQAARGVFRVVTEAMAAAARAHATDRGVDYRGMPLFAFGGAGPVHACEVASLLQSSSVIVPPQPSVLSAFGTLVTSLRLDLVRSDLVRIRDLDWDRVERLLGELVREASAALTEAGCAWRASSDFRRGPALFRPTERALRHPRCRSARASRQRADRERVRGGLSQALWRQSIACSGRAGDVADHRARAHHPVPSRDDAAEHAGPPQDVATGRCMAQGDPTPVYDRKSLAAGQTIVGPAIIEERETTTVIPPDWSATIDEVGCIIAGKG